MSKTELISVCANICHYAQDHSFDWANRQEQQHWEHVSYVVACFIANNTELGHNGVDWDIVFDELRSEVKTLTQWTEIITKVVGYYS